MSRPVIPAEAVEAAAKALKSRCGNWDSWEVLATTALEAAAPYMNAQLLAFADERDKTHGTIRSHITTYELRKLLGATND